MALLYFIKVSGKPADGGVFPPSLNDWETTALVPNLEKHLSILNPNGSVVLIFKDQTELNSFVNAIKLTSEQQAQFDEWKSAHNITVTHSVHELPSSDISVLNPF